MNNNYYKSFVICCLVVSAVLVSLVGCRPKGVLSNQEMEDLLYELHMTDGVIDQAGMVYGHDEEQRAYYAVTMQKLGITQEEFDSSIVWYTHHPQTFNKIYPKVMKRLEDKKAEYTALLLATKEQLTSQTKPFKVLPPIEDVLKQMHHGLPLVWYQPIEPIAYLIPLQDTVEVEQESADLLMKNDTIQVVADSLIEVKEEKKEKKDVDWASFNTVKSKKIKPDDAVLLRKK